MQRPELKWRWWIAEAIEEAVRRVGGGFLGLENAISEELKLASDPDRRGYLGRRQLARLARADPLPLTADQFETLNAYLERTSPASLLKRLDRPNIVQQAAQRQHVCFCLGAQPEESGDRIDISRWDVLSQRELQNAMLSGVWPRIDLEDVIHRGEESRVFRPVVDAVTGQVRYNIPANERWWPILQNETGPSVITIASPLANHAAEVAQSLCLDCTPFSTWSAEFPFGFLWSPHSRRAERTFSTFKVPLEMARGLDVVEGAGDFCTQLDHPDAAKLCGVVFNGRIYPVRRPLITPRLGERTNRLPDSWWTYGVICGRRFGTRVILSVAGVTGAATLGCAQVASRFSPDLSQGAAACLVKVRVENRYEPPYRGDTRKVLSSDIIEEYPVRVTDTELANPATENSETK